MGRLFYNGGDGKFLKSPYIVGREVLPPPPYPFPLFYEDPTYIAYLHHFFKLHNVVFY